MGEVSLNMEDQLQNINNAKANVDICCPSMLRLKLPEPVSMDGASQSLANMATDMQEAIGKFKL